MQKPAFGDFLKESGTTYGRPWHANLADEGCTLTLPDGGVLLEDDAWRPDEASYRMLLRVLDELEGLTRAAAGYLAAVVDPVRHGMQGTPYLNHLACDARAERVTLAMTWETKVYAEYSVTFAWRVGADGGAPEYRPLAMGFRNQ